MIRVRHLLALTLALVLLVPAAAWAGPVREYQLQYEPTGDADGALMIVSALVDPQLPLPVTITVPVPHGSTLLWAGEILGGPAADDPASATTVEQVGDMDVYTLTVTQSYTVQLELQVPAPTVDGKTVSASSKWTNPGDPVVVTAAVIVEAGAEDVKTEPELLGSVQTNDAGESLYPLTGVQLATGETYAIDVEWTRTSSAGASGGQPKESSPVPPAVLLALVAAIVALVIVVARERTKARRGARPAAPIPVPPVRDSGGPGSDDDLTWS